VQQFSVRHQWRSYKYQEQRFEAESWPGQMGTLKVTERGEKKTFSLVMHTASERGRTHKNSAGAAKATRNERLDVVRCGRGGCFGRMGGDIEHGFVTLICRTAHVSTVPGNKKEI
jgi:hypothetical protein